MNDNIKTIDHLERLPLSRNDNPRFRVTFTDGTTAVTKSDASIGYKIENPEYRGMPLLIRTTPSGQIYDLVISDRSRPLQEIAREIRADWKNVYFGAAPYLGAMFQLDAITDDFYSDSAASIVRYFLANARTWRGETARRIKEELRSMVDGVY